MARSGDASLVDRLLPLLDEGEDLAGEAASEVACDPRSRLNFSDRAGRVIVGLNGARIVVLPQTVWCLMLRLQ